MKKIIIFLVTFLFSSLNIIHSQTVYPPISPKWVFEPLVWEDEHNTKDAAWTMVNSYLDRDIPVGAIIIDSPWELGGDGATNNGYNNFLFHTTYSQPKKFIQDLNNKGIHVILWITGIIDTGCQLYKDAKSKNYFVNNGATTSWWKGSKRASHIDFFNPNAVAYWRNLMNRVLDSLNVDGWKVDESDYRIHELGTINTFQGMKTQRQYSDAYYSEMYNYIKSKKGSKGMIMARPYCEQIRNDPFLYYNFAPVSVNTAGWVGDQEYSWNGLLLALRNIFTSAKLGYAVVGSDMGYLNKTPNKNLLIRWAQSGALLPLMDNGGQKDAQHFPWLYDDQTVGIYRYFAKLHHQLVPYLYSYDIQAHIDAISIVRPIGPDTNSWKNHWEYLLGNELFVSAIYQNSNSKTINFPSGKWINYWNENDIHLGGTTATINYTLNQYPVFIRSGAIIAMNVDDSELGFGSESSKNFLTLLIYPDGLSSFKYNISESNSTNITCNRNSKNIKIYFDKSTDSLIIRLKNQIEPVNVILNNGIILQKRITFSDFENASSGWYHGALRSGENIYTWIKSTQSADSLNVITASETDCPAGMISYWKLDETNGSVYDDNVGTNNAASNNVPLPVTGRVAGAQQFNGTSNRITAPGIAAYDFSASSGFTFEAWINHPSVFYTKEEVIFERKPSSGNLVINLKFNSTRVTFLARNISGQVFSVTGLKNLFDGKWHHIAGVKDGSLNQLRIYVDGILEKTVSAVYTSGFSSGTAGISIGWRNKAGDESYFKGSIDEAAIYNIALDAASITQHYNNGLQNKGYCEANVNDFLTVTPLEREVGSESGSITFNVSSNLNWETHDDADWCQVDPDFGNGNGTITATFTANPLTIPRAATIQVIGGGITRIVTLTQLCLSGTVCPSAMLSYWKLDETSGNVYDDYVGTNNASSTDAPTPVVGRVGGGQQFNGTSDKISVPRIAAYDFAANSSFTFETWINHPSGTYTKEEVIIERKPSSGSLVINLKFNSTSVTFLARNTSGQLFSVTGTTNLFDGKWHHVVGVKDGVLNQLRIYVDGVLEKTASAAYTAGFASSNAGISIGWRNNTSDPSYFKGSIDEVAIYNNALDAASITQHYNNGLQNKGYCQISAGDIALAPDDVADAEDSHIPTEYKLLQNYPNPFNPSTKINYSIPQSGFVKLIVYDMLGKETAILVNEEKSAGNYEVTFNGSNLANGIYIFRLQAGNNVQSRKMILLK